ncbi:MAG TPA: phosphoribosylformylglycinamidine cyclo-ligase [Anaerohalosphaeraceae bacterium]|nr:phosphoribosylformylglycinamidine cyclo-ligase [Phycisphaerae bacterium]HOK95107.1 phosphoribosylformylglycinamidine cyclo-ligase [Anaerohalosphaeraceae bacterium]HOL31052.1 phosphoribosylformylglycinamidine cyclo-ligase [Anaerohalosphaeraceae bacterium]HOM75880.1 phosphoribosylformylglycinamidine cyclo-ligase [Anaerohalosphaeraceae bacterium]HPC64145.1 phosphoribosylformylglycinamidine cyclo-ligase [Anaerohalosphaeraceae bacterium]
MRKKTFISYEESGVSIDANDRMVERISRSVVSTHGPRVINLENGFAGLFRLDYDEKLFKRNYRNPVLVACTDGVGTKVLIAQQMGRFDTVGIDLVAMSVNDMIVQGAEPLLFLDYLGVNKLEPEIIAQMVESIAAGCRMADCALIGGETAEMPDIYDKKGEYDMAGFAVGVVERDRIITGSDVRKGDVVLGLASSGLHSNGFTLVRHICFKKNKLKTADRIDALDGARLGDILLEPTRIYVRSIVNLLHSYKVKKVVHGMAHITGGGLVGNIPRVLPADCNAVLKKNAWPVPKIFRYLQKIGPVEEYEMYRVFNMGIGFVLIVAADFADAIAAKLTKSGEQVYRIGMITAGSRKVVLK